jgi:hypothetical protein
MDAIGTADRDFTRGLISHLAIVNVDAEDDEVIKFDNLNFMLSVIKGIEPRDQLEAMLGAQIAAIYVATMRCTQRLMHSINVFERDSAERSLIKLTRTFADLRGCLKRYRASGPQTVQNVAVAEGGQAIVANLGPLLTGTRKVGASVPPAAETNGVRLKTRERPRIRN